MGGIHAVPHAGLRVALEMIRTGLHTERLPNRREVKGVPIALALV
jgi:hypothetical protein